MKTNHSIKLSNGWFRVIWAKLRVLVGCWLKTVLKSDKMATFNNNMLYLNNYMVIMKDFLFNLFFVVNKKSYMFKL